MFMVKHSDEDKCDGTAEILLFNWILMLFNLETGGTLSVVNIRDSHLGCLLSICYRETVN